MMEELFVIPFVSIIAYTNLGNKSQKKQKALSCEYKFEHGPEERDNGIMYNKNASTQRA